MGADSLLAVSVCILLIAGAIPPTEPGPGMFPATAAAWAAAAAWAVAACCCICLWHWRRSNTCRDSAAIKPSNRARRDEITPTDRSSVRAVRQARWPVWLPWCRHWGRFCEQHLQALAPPPCPDSSSEQTPRGHSGIAPTRPPRPYTPAERLCRCAAWEGWTGGYITEQNFHSQNEMLPIHFPACGPSGCQVT